jgi:hypothetical protein
MRTRLVGPFSRPRNRCRPIDCRSRREGRRADQRVNQRSRLPVVLRETESDLQIDRGNSRRPRTVTPIVVEGTDSAVPGAW